MISALYIFVPRLLAGKALMRNFNSQEGMFKPILRIKITPEDLPIQQSGHKNVQSRG